MSKSANYNNDEMTVTTEIKPPLSPMNYEEKLKKMFWSVKPPLGFIQGEYYHSDTLFYEGHRAVIDVVRNNGKIVHVELDEIAYINYYAPSWAGRSKRYSGYAFFQAQSERTDSTLVTLVNGLVFLENQMQIENRLSGGFQTCRGASNSARDGFIPAAAELAKEMEKPSKQYYYGLAKDLNDGIFARLQIITESNKIVDVKYDEIFGDYKEDIKNPNWQQFYRCSKYHGAQYAEITGTDFKAFSDSIRECVLLSQDLTKVSDDIKCNMKLQTEFENYMMLAEELWDLMKRK